MLRTSVLVIVISKEDVSGMWIVGGSGKCCAVKGCHNSYRKLKNFLDQECYEHKPKTRSDCQCPRPFKLHKMRPTDESRRQWLAALNWNFPPVTSTYAPSTLWTDNQRQKILIPTFAGYDRPLRRREDDDRVRRRWDYSLLFTRLKPYCDFTINRLLEIGSWFSLFTFSMMLCA